MNRLNMMALSDFNLVATHGGFGKASRATGRPKATLSRHVGELEEMLGVRLIDRIGRLIRVTEEGKLLLARTDSLINEVFDIAEELKCATGVLKGKLRISVPILFGLVFMKKYISTFIQKCPHIELELVPSDVEVDIFETNFDALIRINPSANSDLVGRRFYKDEVLIVGPRNFGDFSLQKEDGLQQYDGIVKLKAPQIDTWQFERDGEVNRFLCKAKVRLSSPALVREAVLSGVGVARLARKIVAPDIERGDIVVWGKVPNSEINAWILYPSRRHVSARLNAFINFITEVDFSIY